MARLWTEGWEMKDFAGYFNSGATFSDSIKRSGNTSLYVSFSSYWVNIPLSSAISEGYLRSGIYRGTGGRNIIRWYSGATELGSLRVNSSGYITLYVGGSLVATSTTTALTAGVWYRMELHINIADSGILECKLDGVDEISYTGDTKPDTNTTFDTLRFTAGSFNDTYFDDCALNDTTGGADNSWCGDGKIIALFPDATEAQGLLGSDGDTTNNHLLVDEKPADGDTTYVYGVTTDLEDLYSFPACGLSGVTIKRVWAEARARQTVATTGEVALVVKPSGGTSDVSADFPLLNTYTTRVIGSVYTVNPADSAAWEVADIDAIQGGPRVR